MFNKIIATLFITCLFMTTSIFGSDFLKLSEEEKKIRVCKHNISIAFGGFNVLLDTITVSQEEHAKDTLDTLVREGQFETVWQKVVKYQEDLFSKFPQMNQAEMRKSAILKQPFMAIDEPFIKILSSVQEEADSKPFDKQKGILQNILILQLTEFRAGGIDWISMGL